MIDEPPISNVEAECMLLGGLMCDNRLIDRAAELVEPADFADQFLGQVYGTMLNMHGLNQQANPVTLKPMFEGHPALVELGGPAFFAQLTGSGSVVVAAIGCARQVADLAGRRRLAEALTAAAVECGDFEQQIDAIAGQAEAGIAEALKVRGGSATMSASNAIMTAVDAQFSDSPGVVCRLIPSLDYALGPICGGDLVILAGRPSMGKTATALTYSHGVAEQGHGVTILSLEMRAHQLGGRLACDLLFDTPEQVPYAAVSRSLCTPEQRRYLSRAALRIKELPLWVEDLPSATLARAGAIVRKHKRRLAARGKTLRLVVVDYLQLLQPDGRVKSLYEAVSQVSRGLKQLAKQEDVGILALCQLSRDVERRPDKRPTLSDLRDSGQLEQDADSICFLLRMEEYLRREEPDQATAKYIDWQCEMAREAGKIDFIVAKCRSGVTSTGRGIWRGEFQAVRG